MAFSERVVGACSAQMWAQENHSMTCEICETKYKPEVADKFDEAVRTAAERQRQPRCVTNGLVNGKMVHNPGGWGGGCKWVPG